MTRRRSLSVFITDVAVCDHALPPPRVGAVTEFPLAFSEVIIGDKAGAIGEAMTVRGVLELSHREPHLVKHVPGPDIWMWRGVLRGDGWSASWWGRRPLTGPVELTGWFSGVLDYDNQGRVRGRITRAQIVSEPYRRVDERSSERVPGVLPSYRDVAETPAVLGNGGRSGNALSEYQVEVGTLIDLDLDDVPPVPARPGVVPGDVSAAGTNVWVLDTELPVVVQLAGDDSATEYLLPARSVPGRKIAATATGCWIYGPDGLYRCAAGEPAAAVDSRSVRRGAVLGECFLAYTDNRAWTLHTPDRPPTPVTAPAGTPVDIVADGSGFLVALHDRKVPGKPTRLLRITLAGEVIVGPFLHGNTTWRRWFFAGSPARLFHGHTVASVNDDLELRSFAELPRTPANGGAVGDRLWAVTGPRQLWRSRSAEALREASWWPQPEPADYDVPRVPSMLLTFLDVSTLEPVSRSIPIPDAALSVTVDHRGRTWVVDRHGVHIIGDESARWPAPVNLSPRILNTVAPEPVTT